MQSLTPDGFPKRDNAPGCGYGRHRQEPSLAIAALDTGRAPSSDCVAIVLQLEVVTSSGNRRVTVQTDEQVAGVDWAFWQPRGHTL